MRIKYLSRQDIKIILHYLGYIMVGIGAILMVPIIIDVLSGEYVYHIGLIPPLISIGLGYFFVKVFRKYNKLRSKHAMIISSISWLWAGFIAAIIMMLVLDVSFIDAFFENISAWTGSGLTMFNDVESLPMSILFLRSLEQWIGGLGVVIIFISLIIKPGTSAYKLYKSEAREDRLKPSIKHTLEKAIEIYFAYTLLGIILYLLAGLPLFDSINLTFTTISTGGMSIKNANVGFYNNNIVYLITMFLMILGATSFTVHYKMVKTKGKAMFKDIQFQFLIAGIIIAGTLVALMAHIAPMNAIFHVVSAITTTGANIATPSDMASWGCPALIIIMILMVMGGSSGSTVGAVKLIRVITVLKSTSIAVTNIISPARVVSTRIKSKKINETEMKEASSYIAVYLSFLAISWIIMTFYTNDPINTLFDVTSTIGNIGLSTGIINVDLNTFPKILLIFLMWLGRLEIIPILMTIQIGFETFDQSIKLVKRSIRNKIGN
ncbi:TrkH family potassium uptake protein [Methanobrevibacter sp.]|uniref:TrkH family potassium uptake protein n=1 Tax=Methanobrevibacter sp. TaxID=66852 RepID=UPI0025DD0E57|nr:TrkH family potassium uptake protein [Methanobrevibacter sp.]MBQ2961956.1 TrkH family potassium uptake protein [Methanobrevibacter sp.]